MVYVYIYICVYIQLVCVYVHMAYIYICVCVYVCDSPRIGIPSLLHKIMCSAPLSVFTFTMFTHYFCFTSPFLVKSQCLSVMCLEEICIQVLVDVFQSGAPPKKKKKNSNNKFDAYTSQCLVGHKFNIIVTSPDVLKYVSKQPNMFVGSMSHIPFCLNEPKAAAYGPLHVCCFW